MSDGLATAATRLAAALDESGPLLVVTGAGVSLASGIPTFRGTDPEAIWKRDLTELATFEYFRRDPVGSWRWYLERFHLVLEAEPNPAHHALAALESRYQKEGDAFLLVTQNVDTLHEQAGSERLVKVHGTSDRVRCSGRLCRLGAPRGSIVASRVDFERFRSHPSAETLPRCPECESPLRPHVLWFDEYYGDHVDYQWERVLAAATRATTTIFVGTSFSVGVTDAVLHQALANGARILSVDLGAHAPPHPDVRLLPVAAEEVLPEACRELGVRILAS